MLEDLKLLLGIGGTELDEKLTWILSTTKRRLQIMLGGIEPPENMYYMITEISVIRFNRIGSEGVSAHSVDGESMTFADDDFAPYMAEINAYLDSQSDSKRGKLRFL